MVKWNLRFVVDAVRVIAGNAERSSNDIEVARDGKPIYDKFRSLGLFGMERRLKWAHVLGTSMVPEGIADGAYIAYADLVSSGVDSLTAGDVVLVEIRGETKRPNLHGGYKLRKFVSVCPENSLLFDELTYDKQGRPHAGKAERSLIRGKVLFH